MDGPNSVSVSNAWEITNAQLIGIYGVDKEKVVAASCA